MAAAPVPLTDDRVVGKVLLQPSGLDLARVVVDAVRIDRAEAVGLRPCQVSLGVQLGEGDRVLGVRVDDEGAGRFLAGATFGAPEGHAGPDVAVADHLTIRQSKLGRAVPHRHGGRGAGLLPLGGLAPLENLAEPHPLKTGRRVVIHRLKAAPVDGPVDHVDGAVGVLVVGQDQELERADIGDLPLEPLDLLRRGLCQNDLNPAAADRADRDVGDALGVYPALERDNQVIDLLAIGLLALLDLVDQDGAAREVDAELDAIGVDAVRRPEGQRRDTAEDQAVVSHVDPLRLSRAPPGPDSSPKAGETARVKRERGRVAAGVERRSCP